jgi:CRISPR-associated exonuclease Cas4
MEPTNQPETISVAALNQYVFCPRRCALMFVEGIWADNEHTAVGTLLHDHADAPGYETDAGVTILRAVPLFSHRYGLSGKADIVEVRARGEGQSAKGEGQGVVNFELRIADCEMKPSDDDRELQNASSETEAAPNKSTIRIPKSEIPLVYAPVEYKKGKRRKWDNDDVQLCAQAFCLEEMFSVTVPEGFIYHAGSKRRRKVSFDESLRSDTRRTIEAVRALVANREVPPAVLKPRCDGCSLRSICLPELTQIAGRAKVEAYEKSLWL